MVQKGNKTRLKYLGKEGYDFKFEEVDSAQEVILKIWKDKPFINDLVVNEIGYGLVNENWLNGWEKFNAQEPTPTTNVQQTLTQPKAPKQVNGNIKGLSGARGGMIINNAVQIAIAEFEKSDSRHLDLNRVTGIANALNSMFPDN